MSSEHEHELPPAEPAEHEAPPPQAVASEPVESRRDRLTRHAHRARLYASAVFFIAFLAVLILFAADNAHTVKVGWVVGSTQASLVWVIFTAAVVGWMLGIATSVLARHRTRRRR